MVCQGEPWRQSTFARGHRKCQGRGAPAFLIIPPLGGVSGLGPKIFLVHSRTGLYFSPCRLSLFIFRYLSKFVVVQSPSRV